MTNPLPAYTELDAWKKIQLAAKTVQSVIEQMGKKERFETVIQQLQKELEEAGASIASATAMRSKEDQVARTLATGEALMRAKHFLDRVANERMITPYEVEQIRGELDDAYNASSALTLTLEKNGE